MRVTKGAETEGGFAVEIFVRIFHSEQNVSGMGDRKENLREGT